MVIFHYTSMLMFYGNSQKTQTSDSQKSKTPLMDAQHIVLSVPCFGLLLPPKCHRGEAETPK